MILAATSAPADSLQPALSAARSAIAAALAALPRREWLVAVHNPWSHAAHLVDAWKLLDLCHAPELLDRIEALIGPDIVLWDSELSLEGPPPEEDTAFWPFEPRSGAIAVVHLGVEPALIGCFALGEAITVRGPGPYLVIRYAPATSLMVRDPQHDAHRAVMEAEPLIDRTRRPLWLVRGVDRAGNDFVTGFALNAPCWAVR